MRVNVYGRNLSFEDKDFIFLMLSHIDVTKGMIKFIDLADNVPNTSENISLCFDNTHTDVSRAYVRDGKYAARDFLSSNMIDESNKFVFMSIPLSPREIKSLDANKALAWEKLKELKFHLERLGYFSLEEPVTQEKVPVEEPKGEVKQEPESTAPAVKNISSYKELIGDELPNVSIDVENFLREFTEKIKISDPALGSSLKLNNRIVFECENGTMLTVYPTNIIADPDAPGGHIAFKDLLSVLKMSLLVGSKKIHFFKDK